MTRHMTRHKTRHMTRISPGKPSSDLGTPLKRQEPLTTLNSSSEPKIVPHSSTGSALPGVYNKISFPILTPNQKKLLQQQQEDGKRIVLQIKHGNSTTMEKSPDGQSKVVKHGGAAQPLGLVPYNSDSDSEPDSAGAGSSKSSSDKKEEIKTVNAVSMSGDAHNQPPVKKNNHSQPGAETRPLTEKGDASNLNSTQGSSSHSSTSGSQSLREEPQKHSSDLSNKGLHKNISHNSAAGPLTGSKNGPMVVELPAASMPSTSSSCPKVRVTGGNWLIQTQDSAPSPRSSCSSANSVNSTTEWTVESKESTTKLPDGGLSQSIKTEIVSESKNCNNEQYDRKTDKQPLIGTKDSSVLEKLTSCIPQFNHTKKVKKHKKKKIKSSDDDEVRKKKEHSKKKKKHKEKKRKRDKDRKGSDYDSHESSKAKRKKRSRSQSTSSSSSSSSSNENDSEDGYEWVEKTKENVALIKPKIGPVSVQSWNHHIKDDVAPKKDSSIQKMKSLWDGSKPSKLPTESESSSFSLGKNVLSWDGGRNHIDDDKDKVSKKRKFSDAYNDDIDAGKVKKVKNISEASSYSKGYNPFQQFQSDRQLDKVRNSGVWKEDHSYYQNNHHDSKWKTYS
ncbi:hypothetical protein Btru_072377 [Bulinus truncatus]|nr:hypothetical protein Btru_072377 [Bulinus truncatus]